VFAKPINSGEPKGVKRFVIFVTSEPAADPLQRRCHRAEDSWVQSKHSKVIRATDASQWGLIPH
jgi:hypothetical protein